MQGSRNKSVAVLSNFGIPMLTLVTNSKFLCSFRFSWLYCLLILLAAVNVESNACLPSAGRRWIVVLCNLRQRSEHSFHRCWYWLLPRHWCTNHYRVVILLCLWPRCFLGCCLRLCWNKFIVRVLYIWAEIVINFIYLDVATDIFLNHAVLLCPWKYTSWRLLAEDKMIWRISVCLIMLAIHCPHNPRQHDAQGYESPCRPSFFNACGFCLTVRLPRSTSPWDWECRGLPLINITSPPHRSNIARISKFTNSLPLSEWKIFDGPA